MSDKTTVTARTQKLVAFYMPAFAMGDAQMVAAMVSRLKERGFEVLVIVDEDAGAHRAGFPAGSKIAVLALRPLPMLLRDHRIRTFADWARLRRILKEAEPSWLLVSHTAVGAVAAIAAAKSLKGRTRCAVFLTGAPGAGRRIRAFAKAGYHLLGRILSLADVLLGDSYYACRAWQPWFRGRSPSFFGRVPLPRVINNQLRNSANEQGGPTVISFGRLVPQKQFGLCIEAIAQLRQQGIPVNLSIFGEGEEKASLSELIADLNLGDCVRLAGFTHDTERHLRSADAYVQSSEWEPLGMGILEALNYGLPVASTDCAGPSEILRDSVGWLAPKGDAAGLARAIVGALAAPREDGRRQARAEEYNLDRGLDQVLDMMDLPHACARGPILKG